MKKSNVMMAVCAVILAAASVASAENMKFDFDGNNSGGISFEEFVKTANACQKDAPACSAEVPPPAPAEAVVRPAAAKDVKIKVVMKIGASVKEETLTCQAGENGQIVKDCKKKSDSKVLKEEDVNVMLLRRYLPMERADFGALLNQTRHSYCNNSGPQTFCCDDVCAHFATSQIQIGISNGLPQYQETEICTSWTHECTCTKNCY